MSSKRAWRRSWFGCREFVPREFQGVPVQGNIVPDCVPSCEHRTVRFVREIAEGCDTFDTTLWQSIEAGEVIRRWLGGVPVVINRRPAFARYAEIVKKSLDYADTHGILPCAAKLDPAPPGSHPDVDIGIAIIGQHGMVKYRKGKHRFAYALALGIPVIPCRCYFAEARAIDDLDWAAMRDASAKNELVKLATPVDRGRSGVGSQGLGCNSATEKDASGRGVPGHRASRRPQLEVRDNITT